MNEVSYVSVSYTHLFLRELRRRPEKMNQHKFVETVEMMESPLSPVDFDPFKRLLMNYFDQADQKELGLVVGLQHHPCVHGSLGQAIISADTLTQALTVFVDFFRLLTNTIELKLEENEKGIVIGIHESIQDERVRRYSYEVLMLSFQSICNFFTGLKTQEAFYAFPYSPPTYQKHYLSAISGTVAFQQSQPGVMISQEILQSTSVCRHKETFDMAYRRCERLKNIRERTYGFRDAVERLILQDMGAYCNLKNVSKHFNISTRTLTRKLKEENACFQDILTNIRKESAQHLLIYGDQSIEEISSALGYQDSGNFARAFRRWFGETPAHYRESRANNKVIQEQEV